MLRTLIAIILIMFLFASDSFAQETTQPRPARVRVSVSGPENLRTVVEGHLVRALEAQGSIVHTESNPHWILQIVAVEMEDPQGDKASILVSALVLEVFQNAPLQVFLSDKLDDATVTAIGRLTSGLFRLSSHWIETAPAGDLEGLVESITAQLNSAVACHQESKSDRASGDQ